LVYGVRSSGEALAEWMHPDFELGTPKKGESDLDFSQIEKRFAKIKPLLDFACMVHLASLLPVQVSCTIKIVSCLGVTKPLDRCPKNVPNRMQKRAKKSPDLKRRLKQGKCPKWDPKRPVKQGTLKIQHDKKL
jgi:hypothetical protein